MMQIDRWRYYTRQNAHNGDYCLDSSRCPHCMSNHRLGRTNRYPVSMFSEAVLYSICLSPVVIKCRCAMSINIVDLIRTYPGFLQCSTHSLRSTCSSWWRLGLMI